MENSKPKEKSVLAELMGYAGKRKILTILACILSAISATVLLLPYVFVWKVVQIVINNWGNLSGVSDAMIRNGWLAVICAIAGLLIYACGLMCSHLAAFRTASNIRRKTLDHLLTLPMGYFSQNTSGRLRRIVNDSAGQTEAFLAHQLPDLTGALVTPIVMLVLFFIFDWRLGLISLIPLIVCFIFLMRMTGKRMADKMAQYQGALQNMNSQAVEYVRGIPVVKTFQQSVFSFKNFHDAITHYKKWVVEYTVNLRMAMCGFTLGIHSVFAFLIPAGIIMIMTSGDYKAFLLDFIFYIIFAPLASIMLTRIMFSTDKIMTAKDAMSRINDILSEKPLEIASNPQVPKDNSVEFNGVGFSYANSNNDALKNVSFKINEGQTFALVGPSGGGKTTAATLIPRFYDVKNGSVKIGGVDVRDISETELMSRISFVFQQTTLFKASLYDNIKMSRPNATREEILKAAHMAQCDDIIAKMPNGIDTVVGTKGVYLSGGEAQRIALARAMLKNAPIILLDEATAFADPENEYQIQLAFEQLTKGKTVLMIAHRLSTVCNADKILVMADGEIKESGTHKNLLDSNGLYSQMWNEYQTSAQWKISREAV